MSSLSKSEINQYSEKGYLAPIDALTKDEANEVDQEFGFFTNGLIMLRDTNSNCSLKADKVLTLNHLCLSLQCLLEIDSFY